MMKNVTIFTSDEMEMIIYEINNLIDNARDGIQDRFNAKDVCYWMLDDLQKLKERFEES